MCLLLYTYGVRGGQVRALRFEDLDWAGDRVRFRALKHGKETVLPLTEAVGLSLYRYLQQRPSRSYRRIFLSSRAPFVPLARSCNLSTRVATWLDRAGIEHVPRGAHAFRHGFATRKLAEGHTLKAIADILGHRHLDTTFVYAKVDFQSRFCPDRAGRLAMAWRGTMSGPSFHSALAKPIEQLIALRQLSGTDYLSQVLLLGHFDRYVATRPGITHPTRDLIEGYEETLAQRLRARPSAHRQGARGTGDCARRARISRRRAGARAHRARDLRGST